MKRVLAVERRTNEKAKKRIEKYAKLFLPIFPFKEGESLLEVGSGDGLWLSFLRERCNLSVFGIDIYNSNKANIPFKVYDGANIPFKQDSFDYALFFATLHHCRNQRDLVRQASHIAKKGVIIVDSNYKNLIEKFLLNLQDFLAHAKRGVFPPYYHLNNTIWRSIIEEKKLAIVQQKTIPIKRWGYTFNGVYYHLLRMSY